MRKTKKIPPKTVKYTEKIGKNLLMRLLGQVSDPKKILKMIRIRRFLRYRRFFSKDRNNTSMMVYDPYL